MRVHVKQEVRAPASAVWELIGGMDSARSWRIVESFELEGRGVGCVRTLHLVGGDRVVERLEAHDEQRRTYTASVLDPGSIPVRDLRYSVSISEAGTDSCTVEWIATFEAEGAPPEQMQRRIEGFFVSTTASIRDRLGA
jgi:hypothetical protein